VAAAPAVANEARKAESATSARGEADALSEAASEAGADGGQFVADASKSKPVVLYVRDLPAQWSRHSGERWASSAIQRAAPGSPESSFGAKRADGTDVPHRIVSLTPGVTETLFAIGVQKYIVGVSEYCDYPPEASGIPRVGSFLSPVVEAVAAMEPDLVITSPSPGNKNSVDALERAGMTVAVVTEGSDSIADVEKAIREIAKLVGRPLEGEAIVGSIESKLEAVRKRVDGKRRPKTAVVVGHDPLVLAGPKSYLGELVVNGGGRNIADELGGKWPRTSWEYLVSAAPEVVIDLSMGSEADSGEAAAMWSRYSDVPAVSKDRVYTGGAFLLLHPGPRTDEQAVLISRYLHPAAWTGSD
jgi:iron complex transport system substrate-binding protein